MFSPYSSAYVALTVFQGSFPGRRAATKPQPSLHASAAPEDEPARLGPEDEVGLARLDPLGQQVDRLAAAWPGRPAAA